MIKLPVQKLPKLQDRPFFFRTMENDRYQSQIQGKPLKSRPTAYCFFVLYIQVRYEESHQPENNWRAAL